MKMTWQSILPRWKKKVVDCYLEAPQTLFLAEDEACLYLQATTTHVWAPLGQTPVVKIAANRECQHFYGTLNLLTGEEIAMKAARCNSDTTAEHLQQVLDHYPDVPIVMLWDRAPWHQGEAVRQLVADNPRLELMRLPTAAPDLNPQEHVWKAVRAAQSHNHTTTRLTDLSDRWLDHLTSTNFPSSLLDDFNLPLLKALSTIST
ncbi:IS630 family transposase [Candidatus Saccharibacteria bacterium]|nr:IS630 family transposase [Candidatus Saccharibacteria bacterium]